MVNKLSFSGKRVAVFGLGKSGIAAALALRELGVEILAWDDSAKSRDHARNEGVSLTDIYTADWQAIDVLILSPGVPLHHPAPHAVVLRARHAGCEIIGDIEVLSRLETNAGYIGITGTNGKSTTTALVGHILQKAGRDVEIGGNLGFPALEMKSLSDDGVYVLEMSSYQIELSPTLVFDVAVLLNITPDHLDRHGGMDGYVAAKKEIFRSQRDQQTAIVGIDTEPSREICEELQKDARQRVIPVSGRLPVAGGVYALDGMLIDNINDQRTEVMDLRKVPTLSGEHNWQNAAAAYATVRSVGVDVETAVTCIGNYPGLVHRQEIVKIIGGVLFINDSKATNPDAAATALASYDNIYWIVGGQTKDGGFDPVMPYLDRVRHAFLIGAGAEEISAAIGADVACTLSGDIKAATSEAFAQAVSDQVSSPVVILSPACASFDQFSNFEERGCHFKTCVAGLKAAS